MATKALSLKSVDSGAKVTLMEPYDKGVNLGRRQVDGRTVRSPPQTCLDLISMRGLRRGSRLFPSAECAEASMVGSRVVYPDLATKAVRTVMLELVRVPGEYKDSMAIVGGWKKVFGNSFRQGCMAGK